MMTTQAEFQYTRQRVMAQMIQILIDEQHLSLEDAMDKVYKSEMFEKLSNPDTGLFFQSPRYLLSYLQ